jgi:hypothetical protein
MVSVGGNHGLIDDLTLVRDRQTVLSGQLAELFMSEAHDYRMRIIIKQPRVVSTENLSVGLYGVRPQDPVASNLRRTLGHVPANMPSVFGRPSSS